MIATVMFAPIAFENSGVSSSSTCLSNLWLIAGIAAKPVLEQPFNAVGLLLHDSLPAPYCTWWTDDILFFKFLKSPSGSYGHQG